MNDMPAVTHNSAASRFEMHTTAGLAILDYVLHGQRIDFVHTGVPKAAEGKGYGTALAQAGLEHARDNGLSVTPTCPFVRAFIDSHSEFQSLVAPA